MPDNLTVQISANADKLRADLAKAQANVRDFAKQLRDAAAEARKTGDDTRLKKVAAQYEAASRQVRGLTRALREQNAALDATTDKAAGLSKTLGTLGIGLQSTIEKFGKGIFGGLAGATGITKALDVIGQVTDQLNEIRKLEAGTGFSKETIRALQLGLTQTGQAGEKLSGMLVQFAGASGDADKKLRELNKSTEEMSHKFVQVGDGAADTISQIRTMRAEFSQGGKAVQDTVNVWRGAHKALTDENDPFVMLGIDIRQFPTIEKRFEAFAKAFVKFRQIDPGRAVRAGALLTGEDDLTNIAVQLERIAKVGLKQFIKDMEQIGRFPTTEDFNKLDEYNKAWGNFQITIDNIKWDAVIAAFPTLTEGLKTLRADFSSMAASTTTDIKNIKAVWDTVSGATAAYVQSVRDAWEQGGFAALHEQQMAQLQAGWDAFTAYLSTTVWPAITTGWQTTVDYLGSAFKGWADGAIQTMTDFTDWVTAQLDKIRNAAATAWAALGSAFGTAGGVPLPGPGMASGGMVRGPGSGTSDSIMARLSNGEFVMSAGAVRHWGSDLMAALNTSRRVPRFAEGGLVASSSNGVPVHLHFPSGGQVQLHGDKAIVRSLLREARRAGMVAA
jgi:hypothetical protein